VGLLNQPFRIGGGFMQVDKCVIYTFQGLLHVRIEPADRLGLVVDGL
jgi:hypothetical protein